MIRSQAYRITKLYSISVLQQYKNVNKNDHMLTYLISMMIRMIVII